MLRMLLRVKQGASRAPPDPVIYFPVLHVLVPALGMQELDVGQRNCSSWLPFPAEGFLGGNRKGLERETGSSSGLQSFIGSWGCGIKYKEPYI